MTFYLFTLLASYICVSPSLRIVQHASRGGGGGGAGDDDSNDSSDDDGGRNYLPCATQ